MAESLSLLDLPAPLLVAVAASLDDWADRKALRAACRALRAAVDATIGGATLQLSDIKASSHNDAAGGAPRLLQRLQRLHVFEACDDPQGDYSVALARFGEFCLNHMSHLTRFELSGSEHVAWANQVGAARGADVLQLLACVPSSVSEVRADLPYWVDEVEEADIPAIFEVLGRCGRLHVLMLPYPLGTPAGLAAALELCNELPVRSLDLSVSGGPLGGEGVDTAAFAALSRLTDLTHLTLRSGLTQPYLAMHEFLRSLTNLRGLELENWECDEGDCDSLGRTLACLTCLTRFAWFSSPGGYGRFPSDLVRYFAWPSLVELTVADNDIASEEAAILSTLPCLRSLTAFSIALRDPDDIVFTSLDRLHLSGGLGDDALPPTYARAFPSLRVCSMYLDNEQFFPAFALLERAGFNVQSGCTAALADVSRASGRLTALQLNDTESGALAALFPALVSQHICMPHINHLRLWLGSGPEESYLLNTSMWDALANVFPSVATLEVDIDGCLLHHGALRKMDQLLRLRRLSIRNAPTLGRALNQAAIKRLVQNVPELERFEIGFAQGSDSSSSEVVYGPESLAEGVTADWLAALARSVRPRLLRSALLPRGSRWVDW